MKTTLSAIVMKLTRTPFESSVGAIMLGAISFMFDSYVFFWLLTGALVVDAITGITASFKNGDKLASGKMATCTFQKLIGYGAVLLVFAMIDFFVCQLWGITEPRTGLHMLAIGWVLTTEAISILENSQVILGIKIPFVNRIRRIRGMLTEEDQNKA